MGDTEYERRIQIQNGKNLRSAYLNTGHTRFES